MFPSLSVHNHPILLIINANITNFRQRMQLTAHTSSNLAKYMFMPRTLFGEVFSIRKQRSKAHCDICHKNYVLNEIY